VHQVDEKDGPRASGLVISITGERCHPARGEGLFPEGG